MDGLLSGSNLKLNKSSVNLVAITLLANITVYSNTRQKICETRGQRSGAILVGLKDILWKMKMIFLTNLKKLTRFHIMDIFSPKMKKGGVQF